MINGKFGVLESKLVTSKSKLNQQFIEAIIQVCQRIKENGKYKEGVAVATYVNIDTGRFEYDYRSVTPETLNTAFIGFHVPYYLMSKITKLGIDIGLSRYEGEEC